MIGEAGVSCRKSAMHAQCKYFTAENAPCQSHQPYFHRQLNSHSRKFTVNRELAYNLNTLKRSFVNNELDLKNNSFLNKEEFFNILKVHSDGICKLCF